MRTPPYACLVRYPATKSAKTKKSLEMVFPISEFYKPKFDEKLSSEADRWNSP